MKLEMNIEDFSIHATNMTPTEFDSLRIILLTLSDHVKLLNIDSKELSIKEIIKQQASKNK